MSTQKLVHKCDIIYNNQKIETTDKWINWYDHLMEYHSAIKTIKY